MAREDGPQFLTVEHLANRLGMTDPPDTVSGVIDRARQMLSDERQARITAEIDLDAWKEAARLTDEYTLGRPGVHIYWQEGWSLYDVAHPKEGA
jgi:hypothetical protein